MNPPRRPVAAVLLFGLLACQSSAPEPATIETAIVRALTTLPWDHNSHGGPALCPTLAPCDTVWLEPRVVRLPHPAPVFFVPDARPALLILEGSASAALPGIDRVGRAVRYGAWTECLALRHDPAWPTYRRACVALAVAGDTLPADTLQVALLVLTPAEGLRWPRVQLVPAPHGWHGELVSMGGE
jgi:hypothetical protein